MSSVNIHRKIVTEIVVVLYYSKCVIWPVFLQTNYSMSTIRALHALHTQYTQIIRVDIKYKKIEGKKIKTKTKIRQIK